MAAAVIVNAPLMLIFLFAQRFFIDGVTMTAVR
jgi:ABC-type glycerol-3-phosphate transport system permease component